jgi:predicted enzyme related to lactoylglutathione lyase
MNKGISTVVYPVTDLARAKALFTKFLGVEPIADSPYYVGFKIGDQDIGLDPNTHKAGMTAYYQVDNIMQSVHTLVDAGAQILEEVKDVGGGRLVASVKDTDGNIIGLLQDS